MINRAPRGKTKIFITYIRNIIMLTSVFISLFPIFSIIYTFLNYGNTRSLNYNVLLVGIMSFLLAACFLGALTTKRIGILFDLALILIASGGFIIGLLTQYPFIYYLLSIVEMVGPIAATISYLIASGLDIYLLFIATIIGLVSAADISLRALQDFLENKPENN